jgi:peroxiredoxin
MTSDVEAQVAAAEQEWLDHWRLGPTRLRWTSVPIQVGDPAPDLTLRDASGTTRRVSDVWADGPALLLFWRHYGCSCGVERARRLSSEMETYRELGATVVIIGQGEPERSMAYARAHGLECTVLCDPTLESYRAFDLLEGQPSQIVFDAPDEFLRVEYDAGVELQRARHGTERATVDNPWQLPGEFVVDRNGIIRLAYRYQYCEDWPNPLVLVGALKDALWNSS